MYVATISMSSRGDYCVSVLTTHSTQLVLNALANAVLYRPPPRDRCILIKGVSIPVALCYSGAEALYIAVYE